MAPGVYDAAATLLGIGGMTPGVGAINLGTSAMYRTVIRRPALDRTRWMRLQTYHLIRGLWLGGAGVNNAGNVRAWLVRLFSLQDERALDALAARVPPGADGALGLPFLTGARDPRIGGAAAMGSVSSATCCGGAVSSPWSSAMRFFAFLIAISRICAGLSLGTSGTAMAPMGGAGIGKAGRSISGRAIS